MKTIRIQSLSLLNFKGIRNLEINDFGKETNIWGANGSGKTTIFDAFTFLFFGKDSHDRSSFEIKTLDKDNNVIPKIDHEVTAVITVDGEEITLKRIYREKWVKRKGAENAEFAGNETVYEWNGVPMLAKEFSSKVSAIIEESVFKLITNPMAFNSLSWQEQRNVLLNISGGVSEEEVAEQDPAFGKLLDQLKGKSLSEYERQLKASIKKSKDEINMIPTRIDEVERSKPDTIDFADLRFDLKIAEKDLASLNEQITDKLKAQQEVLNRRSELQKEIQKLKEEISEIEHNAKLKAQGQIREAGGRADQIKADIDKIKEEIKSSESAISKLNTKIENEQSDIDRLKGKQQQVKSEFERINAQTFEMDDKDCKCPTCQRAFEADDIQAKKTELETKFNQNKIKALNELNDQGKANQKLITSSKEEIETLKGRIQKGESILEDHQSKLNDWTEKLEKEESETKEVPTESELIENILGDYDHYKSLQKQITELQSKMDNEESVNVEDLKASKEKTQKEVDRIKEQLKAEEDIEKADKRIKELAASEEDLAKTIAGLERDQHTIERFNKAKDDTLEALVNDRFKMVNFKLFDTQVNGGEKPTCKALVNGVPFSDLNTASKINAGIDIINVLCDYYQVTATIFLDNRESVTYLIETDSQIVNLFVSPADKKLRIESNVEQLETV